MTFSEVCKSGLPFRRKAWTTINLNYYLMNDNGYFSEENNKLTSVLMLPKDALETDWETKEQEILITYTKLEAAVLAVFTHATTSQLQMLRTIFGFKD